jgi:hypothetical protein
VAGKNIQKPFNVDLERASVPQEPDIMATIRKIFNAE